VSRIDGDHGDEDFLAGGHGSGFEARVGVENELERRFASAAFPFCVIGFDDSGEGLAAFDHMFGSDLVGAGVGGAGFGAGDFRGGGGFEVFEGFGEGAAELFDLAGYLASFCFAFGVEFADGFPEGFELFTGDDLVFAGFRPGFGADATQGLIEGIEAALDFALGGEEVIDGGAEDAVAFFGGLAFSCFAGHILSGTESGV